MNSPKQHEKPLFFEDPRTEPHPPGEFSVLYLLRRDIIACLNNKTAWPAAMMILAGVDLLAKFHAGEDKVGNAPNRFKNYVTEHFGTPDEMELICQFRSSMLQSFGLRSEDKKGHVYKFMIIASPGEPLFQKRDNRHVVNAPALHKAFEKSIISYKNTLAEPIHLEKFLAMVPEYGFVYKHD